MLAAQNSLDSISTLLKKTAIFIKEIIVNTYIFKFPPVFRGNRNAVKVVYQGFFNGHEDRRMGSDDKLTAEKSGGVAYIPCKFQLKSYRQAVFRFIKQVKINLNAYKKLVFQTSFIPKRTFLLVRFIEMFSKFLKFLIWIESNFIEEHLAFVRIINNYITRSG